MSRSLIALFGDCPSALRHHKGLVCDELAERDPQLTQQLLSEVLELEMDEHCRVTWRERAPQRRDRRNGYYRRAPRPTWTRAAASCLCEAPARVRSAHCLRC